MYTAKFEDLTKEQLATIINKQTEVEIQLKKDKEWLQSELDKAIKYLEQGKRDFAPNTTNSFVDEFIEKHKRNPTT